MLLPQPASFTADQVDAALDLLATRLGVRLHEYRPETIQRRLAWRMHLIGSPGAQDYLERLDDDHDEVRQLLSTLLVSVTSFFRDPEVFHRLAEVVLPDLVARTPRLRAWVAGAATGEEAWTLSMLLADACAPAGADFQILATDLEPEALCVARRACYPSRVLEAIPAGLASRYLDREGATVRVREPLRSRVRFVEHDVIGPRLAPAEAILASFDLVSFRNVLIYFTPALQERVVARIGAVLPAGGALILGTAESVPRGAAESFGTWPGLERRLGLLRRTTR